MVAVVVGVVVVEVVVVVVEVVVFVVDVVVVVVVLVAFMDLPRRAITSTSSHVAGSWSSTRYPRCRYHCSG